jgi:sugar phosphate isomerase/epimerase
MSGLAREPRDRTGPGLERLSLNQKTVDQWGVRQVVDGCARAGVPAVGLWREPVADIGLEKAAKLVRDAGLRVSTLCRGGFLTAADPDGRAAALADNRRAIEEAATLGTGVLVLVVGGLPAGDRDLPGARSRVADAVAELVPHAAAHGVRLAIEPLHPMYCADRAVVSTLGQALDIAAAFPVEQVGVALDTFHVWWDPEVDAQIARAGERIATYQLADWVLPLPADVLLGRGYPGDGHVDFPALTAAVAAAGYTGDIEVEIFNADVWAQDGDEVIDTVVRRYREILG